MALILDSVLHHYHSRCRFWILLRFHSLVLLLEINLLSESIPPINLRCHLHLRKSDKYVYYSSYYLPITNTVPLLTLQLVNMKAKLMKGLRRQEVELYIYSI